MTSKEWEFRICDFKDHIGIQDIRALIADLAAAEERAEKAEASQTEFLKRCAALTIERDALRDEVEDLRAYYEFQRSGWRVTGPAYDDLISRIEARRKQQITPPTATATQPAIKFCSECGTPLGVEEQHGAD